ncbi:DNA alkylation repair protein [Halobacillus sp. Marseille-Q1614]|nr:DNA alkylation repair protein [Halobacillus sp. Marseille-Q1614]
MTALAVLDRDEKKVLLSGIGVYKKLLYLHPWWDIVDMIASKVVQRIL